MQFYDIRDRKRIASRELLEVRTIVADRNLEKWSFFHGSGACGFQHLIDSVELVRSVFWIVEFQEQRAVCRRHIKETIEVDSLRKQLISPRHRAKDSRSTFSANSTSKAGRSKSGNRDIVHQEVRHPLQDAKRYSPPQRVLRRAVVPPRTIFNAHNDIEPYRFRKHFLKIFQHWRLINNWSKGDKRAESAYPTSEEHLVGEQRLLLEVEEAANFEPANKSGSQRISSAHISS